MSSVTSVAMSETTQAEWQVDSSAEGERLDVFLTAQLLQHSRAQVRRAINAGGATIDGQGAKASTRLRAGQVVRIVVPELPREGPAPEAIPIEILYEDDDLAAVVKPPGMVAHPSRGHWSGTLAGALAHHFGQLSTIGGAARPGIVHRLDRDTSGVMVVAKNDWAHQELSAQFAERTTGKVYQAIVAGVPDFDRDLIDEPIGPHPYNREKMAIRRQHPQAKHARTLYEVRRRFARFALVELHPETGRTHQIRLHLAHIGTPVLCDRLYGGRSQITRGELLAGATRNPLDRRRGPLPSGTLPSDAEVVLDRQALHAARLALRHPRDGRELVFESPLPADLVRVLELLGWPHGRSEP